MLQLLHLVKQRGEICLSIVCAAGGFGSFLLAIYDTDAEEYQSISKIGTGFSEELLKEVSAAMQAHVLAQPPRYYRCAACALPLAKMPDDLAAWQQCQMTLHAVQLIARLYFTKTSLEFCSCNAQRRSLRLTDAP